MNFTFSSDKTDLIKIQDSIEDKAMNPCTQF